MIPKNAVGFAILCSLACLCHATAHAADNELPTVPLHGTVVDEKGAPVPHVKVVTAAGRNPDVELAAVTDAAGNFTLPLRKWQIQAVLLAKDESGLRVGSLRYVPGNARPAARIVLRAARVLPVAVVDGKGQPIAGAKIGVLFAARNGGNYYDNTRQRFLRERTDARGRAVLHLPPETPLEAVWAAKAGAGFDYVLYREPVDQRPKKQPQLADTARRAPDDSRPIRFVLTGVHKLRVHVVNERRRPLPGIRLRATHVERPHKGGGVRLPSIDEFLATADSSGTVPFDTLPIDALPSVILEHATVGYFVWENATFEPAEPLSEVTVVAAELPVLRAEVTYPDGRPALGAWVHFAGKQYEQDGRDRSLFDGASMCESPGEMVVHPFDGDAYCVVSATIEGYASKLEARVARMGEPLRPVHLVLSPAARVHGTLTLGKDRRPAANATVTLIQCDQDNYAKLPENERLPRTFPLRELAHVAMNVPLRTTTDERGHFAFDAAPGPYILGAGAVYLNEFVKSNEVKGLFPDGAHEFEIKDQKAIEINLHSDVPPSARKRSVK